MLYQLQSNLLAYSSYQKSDRDGNPLYKVNGKFWTIGHNLSFEAIGGIRIAEIRQRKMSFMPKYELYLGAKHYATFRKEFSWFKKSFTLDVPGPNDYSIKGSFWEHEYVFNRKNRTVATVSRKFFSLTDSYGVDIEKAKMT